MSESWLDEVEQAICNYCNIDAVPWGLRYVWASMTVDYLRWWASQLPDAAGASSMAGRAITSISEGSVSIGLGDDGSTIASARNLAGALDVVVTNYRDQLNKYRRAEW